MATITILKGNFAKLSTTAGTVVRVHALTDGSWAGVGCGATHAEPRRFDGEAAALAWFTLALATLGVAIA